MLKIFIAFVVFAGLALFILSKGGDIDMGGEKHGSEITHTDKPASAAPAASSNAALVITPAAAASVAASAVPPASAPVAK